MSEKAPSGRRAVPPPQSRSRVVHHVPPPLAPLRGVAAKAGSAQQKKRAGPPAIARALQRAALSSSTAGPIVSSPADSVFAGAAAVPAIDKDSEAIWKWLDKGGKSAKFAGLTIYYVAVGHEASNCHHFAFSNFTGAGDLATIVGSDIYEKMSVLFEFPPELTLAANQPAQTICLMGAGPPAVDHSARQEVEGGLWWNKFVGLPYLLGFASIDDCCTGFGYTDTERIAVTLQRGNYDAKRQLLKKRS